MRTSRSEQERSGACQPWGGARNAADGQRRIWSIVDSFRREKSCEVKPPHFKQYSQNSQEIEWSIRSNLREYLDRFARSRKKSELFLTVIVCYRKSFYVNPNTGIIDLIRFLKFEGETKDRRIFPLQSRDCRFRSCQLPTILLHEFPS
jgi:hypothetical protein